MKTNHAAAAAARMGLRKQLEKKRAEMRAEKDRAAFLRLWGEEGKILLALKKACRRAWMRWLRHGGELPAGAGRLQDALTAREQWRFGTIVRYPGYAGTILELPTVERIPAPLLGELWESARRGALN